MEKFKGGKAILVVLLMVASACQPGEQVDADEGYGARTYFASLELGTPEDAVQTFTQAFQREDFMTVYLVLDVEAQIGLRMDQAATISWRHLIGETTAENWMNSTDMRELHNITMDAWYLFDQIMLYATSEDDLLIDLRGDLHILSIAESETQDGEQAMDVITEVDGINGEVVFRLVTDSDGRWRVYMVSALGEGVVSWPSTRLNDSP